MSDQDIERFWAYVDKGPRCWEWTGSRFNKRGGYGQFSLGGRTALNRNRYAHRVSYEIANGSIPKGAFILHSCDNPPCVNPTHLSAGTQTDNIRDMFQKERCSTAKLKRRDIPKIRRLIARGKLTQQQIGAKFGVGQDTISLIKHDKIWRNTAA